MPDARPSKDGIENLLTEFLERSNAELLALSQEKIASEWYWTWDADRSAEWNIYKFSQILELQKHRWRRWEEHHNGSVCVVERVRDRYVMPRIHDFLAALTARRGCEALREELAEERAESWALWEFVRRYDEWAESAEQCGGPLFDAMLEMRGNLEQHEPDRETEGAGADAG